MAVVFKMTRGRTSYALKVLKHAFRNEAMVTQADKLNVFKDVPGLRVCDRKVLTPADHDALIRQHRDLLYAILMPWITGDTWATVIESRRPIPPQLSLALVRSLTSTLATLEGLGIAHGDLSASNLIMPNRLEARTAHDQASSVDGTVLHFELVDIEQLFAPGFVRPDKLLGGSPGYRHESVAEHGVWGPEADRFAGAVLLAEILGWCDAEVCEASCHESYFDEKEMHQSCRRYNLLMRKLQARWGQQVAELFGQAWSSYPLTVCPSFVKWQEVLTSLPNPEIDPNGQAWSSYPLTVCPSFVKWQEVLTSLPNPEIDPNVDTEPINQALRFIERGELYLAIANLELAECQAPHHLRKRIATAVDLLERKQIPEAKDIIGEVILLLPHSKPAIPPAPTIAKVGPPLPQLKPAIPPAPTIAEVGPPLPQLKPAIPPALILVIIVAILVFLLSVLSK